MNFLVMGFEKGKDALIYEHEISLPVQDLMRVMRWNNSADCIGADFLFRPLKLRKYRIWH